MNFTFLDPRYGALGRLDYFLFKYVYLTVASLIFILPPLIFGHEYFPPFYLFIPAAIFIGYLSFVFDIKRLRDLGWSFWLILIPLSPLFVMVPIWVLPGSVFDIFEIMERNPFVVTTIVMGLNLFIMTFQALLLFVKGQRNKNSKLSYDEF